MMRSGLASLLSLTLLFVVAAAPDAAGERKRKRAARTLDAPGQHHRVVVGERDAYELYVPTSYRAGTPAPLLLTFHWSTGRGFNMLRYWTEAAEQHGVIVIAPDSRYTMRWGKKDVAQALDAIVEITASYNVDSARIYAQGFSSGANFTYRMMASNPGLFRGISPFAGRMRASKQELAHPNAADGNTRVCIWHGTTDDTIRFRNAGIAARRLVTHGYEVRTHTVRQGHWFNARKVGDIWGCLDGIRSNTDS